MSEQRPPDQMRTLDYIGPAPKVSVLALVSLVLGILALPLMCFGTTAIFVSVLAGIFGGVALVEIRKKPHLLMGREMARAGMILGLVVVPAVFALLAFAVARVNEYGQRVACAINLRTVVLAMEDYASANGGAFPVLPFAPYGGANAGTSLRTLTADSTTSLQEIYATPGAEAGSPLASVWILVINGRVDTKPFYCPSANIPGPSLHPMTPGGDFYANIQADEQISYSYAYPYTPTGAVGDWWKSTRDASLPLAADIATLAGTGKPKSNPAGTGSVANSNNHGRKGQNVVFADGHTEFVRTPRVGHANDNIYTLSGTATPDPAGKQPPRGPITGHGGSPGAFDVLMVPARNLDTGKLW